MPKNLRGFVRLTRPVPGTTARLAPTEGLLNTCALAVPTCLLTRQLEHASLDPLLVDDDVAPSLSEYNKHVPLSATGFVLFHENPQVHAQRTLKHHRRHRFRRFNRFKALLATCVSVTLIRNVRLSVSSSKQRLFLVILTAGRPTSLVRLFESIVTC